MGLKNAKGVVGEMDGSAFFDGGHTQQERESQASVVYGSLFLFYSKGSHIT